jgi:hypothetical protein
LNFGANGTDEKNMKKIANLVGPDTSAEFESSFAHLAHSYLINKAPALLENLVGFQLIDRSDDETKAAGVFGFRVSGKWLYCVVFFIDGKIFGHDMMYIPESDAILPLKEGWVKYLRSNSIEPIGDSDVDMSNIELSFPDLTQADRNRHGFFGKTSNDRWLKPIIPFLTAMVKKQIFGGMKKAAGDDQKPRSEVANEAFKFLSLDRALSENFELLKAAYDVSQVYPLFGDSIKKFYGENCFLNWGKQLKKAAAKQFPAVSLSPKFKKNTGEEKVEILQCVDPFSEKTASLSDDEKSKLLVDSLLVRDKRAADEVSKLYEKIDTHGITNPTENGVYSVVTGDFQIVRCVVICRFCIPYPGKERPALVIPLSGGLSPTYVSSDSVFVISEVEHDKEWEKWLEKSRPKNFESLSDDGMSGGDHILAICPAGTALPLFRKEYSRQKAKNQSCIWFSCCKKSNQPARNAEVYFSSCEPGHSATISVVKDAKSSVCCKKIGDIIQLPDTYSFEKVNLGGENTINLGDPSLIETAFRSLTHSVKLSADLGSYQIRSRFGKFYGTKSEAFRHLIFQQSLREKEARELLKQAEHHRRVEAFLAYPEKQAFTPAEMFDYPQSTEQISRSRSLPLQTSQERRSVINQMTSQMTDPRRYDMWQQYEAEDLKKSIQSAQQAASQGNKEIFDVSAIVSLLKAVGKEDVIDKYMSSLMIGLDALGRLRMSFIWHRDDFIERYGKKEVPEIEDSLTNSFNSLGDLLLVLKEKSVELPGQAGMMSLSGNSNN